MNDILSCVLSLELDSFQWEETREWKKFKGHSSLSRVGERVLRRKQRGETFPGCSSSRSRARSLLIFLDFLVPLRPRLPCTRQRTNSLFKIAKHSALLKSIKRDNTIVVAWIHAGINRKWKIEANSPLSRLVSLKQKIEGNKWRSSYELWLTRIKN